MFRVQNSPGFLLLAAHKAYDTYLSRKLKSSGIDVTTTQWSIIDQLYYNSGVNQSELAKMCLRDPSAITKTLDIMEKKNLLERKNDSKDRRIAKLYLTEKGKLIRERILPIATVVYQDATTEFTEDEVKDLNSKLNKLIHNLEAF